MALEEGADDYLRKLTDLETRPIEQSAVDLTELLHELLALAQEHPQAEGVACP